MHVPDWANLGLPYYLAIGGGVVAVLAILLYLVSGSRLRIPAIVGSTLGSLVVGLGLGVLVVAATGYRLDTEDQTSGAPGEEGAGPAGPRGSAMMKAKGKMKGGKAKGGMAKGGMPKGGAGGAGAPGGRTKAQLASLVSKLDVLTAKPLAIHLTEDQKKRIQEILASLDTAEQLSDEEAQKKLDALQDVVKPDKETLKAAGYRWPNEPVENRNPRQPLPSNPFKDQVLHQELKSLQDRLAKGSAK